MTIHFCANRYNVQTGQWEYAPRFVERERGRIVITPATNTDVAIVAPPVHFGGEVVTDEPCAGVAHQ